MAGRQPVVRREGWCRSLASVRPLVPVARGVIVGTAQPGEYDAAGVVLAPTSVTGGVQVGKALTRPAASPGSRSAALDGPHRRSPSPPGGCNETERAEEPGGERGDGRGPGWGPRPSSDNRLIPADAREPVSS